MFALPFSKKNKPAPLAIEVLFHKEINGHAEHGTLYASNVQQGLKKGDIVRFGFVDVDPPPEMTPDLLLHVWDQAERKGYEIQALRSYATVFTLQPAPRINMTGANPRAGQNTDPNRVGVARTVRRPSGARTQA